VRGSASTTRVWLFTRSEIRAMATLLSERNFLPPESLLFLKRFRAMPLLGENETYLPEYNP
jgi:hypothetical protein